MGVERAGDRRGSSFGRRGLSRREFLKLSGAGLAGAALLGAAGCGGGGGGNLVFSAGPDDAGTLEEIVNRFNEQNENGIQVEYREMPADSGEHFDQLRTELQAGASPIDVIGGDLIWPAQLAANGWILDLSDRFTEDMQSRFLDPALQSVTWQGKVWGVPWFTDAGLMYYRQDLLEESGFSEAPQTWDELKEMALKTKQDTGTEFGFVFQGSQYEGGVVNAMEYIWTSGGEVLADEGRQAVVDNPDPVEGLRTERSMIEDGVAPVSVVNFKEPETHTAFPAGRAVFARNWPYMYGLLADPEQSSIEPEQVGLAPLPSSQGGERASGLGGWNMYVNAASEDKLDAAWEFIQFATMNVEQQKYRALEGGFLPPLVDLYEDQEILDAVPVASFAREALQSARPRPVSPFYSDLSLVMQSQFAQSLRGDKSPEQAAEDLQREMSNIIDTGERLVL